MYERGNKGLWEKMKSLQVFFLGSANDPRKEREGRNEENAIKQQRELFVRSWG